MSLLGIHSFMFRLKSDKALQDRFRSRAPDAFAGFDLSESERTALAEGKVAELYELGVHPLLLAPFSRYAGIPRTTYIASLAPLKRTRMLRS